MYKSQGMGRVFAKADAAFFILSFPVGALRPVPEAAREKGSLATPFGLSFSAYTVSVPQ